MTGGPQREELAERDEDEDEGTMTRESDDGQPSALMAAPAPSRKTTARAVSASDAEPLPGDIHVTRSHGSLQATVRSSKTTRAAAVAGAVAGLGAMGALGIIVRALSGTMLVAVLGLMALVGVSLLTGFARLFSKRVVVTINGNRVEVRQTGFAPWAKEPVVSSASIEHVFVKERAGGDGGPRGLALAAYLKDEDDPVFLLDELDSAEQGWMLELLIERELGIADEPLADEVDYTAKKDARLIHALEGI